MRVTIERIASPVSWEIAKISVSLEGIGVVYGLSLRNTKAGDIWLAPPSVKTKDGYQNVVLLNGKLRAEILDTAKTMKDGDKNTIEYDPLGDTPMAVYINPYSGDKSLLAMGSVTVKNVVSVNSCTLRRKGEGMIFNMPGFESKGKIYHYLALEKAVYAKVQSEAADCYKTKTA